MERFREGDGIFLPHISVCLVIPHRGPGFTSLRRCLHHKGWIHTKCAWHIRPNAALLFHFGSPQPVYPPPFRHPNTWASACQFSFQSLQICCGEKTGSCGARTALSEEEVTEPSFLTVPFFSPNAPFGSLRNPSLNLPSSLTHPSTIPLPSYLLLQSFTLCRYPERVIGGEVRFNLTIFTTVDCGSLAHGWFNRLV